MYSKMPTDFLFGSSDCLLLRVQSHIEIRLSSRTTLFKAQPPSVSGDLRLISNFSDNSR